LEQQGEDHCQQAVPFREALSELGVPDLPLTAPLLGGIIDAGMTMVEAGQSLEEVTERTTALIHAAITPAPSRAPVTDTTRQPPEPMHLDAAMEV
jgi:hypothetical protein